MESINTNISPVQPEINSQQISPNSNKSFPFVLFLGIAVGITLTVSVVSAVYYFSTKNKTSTKTDNSNQEQVSKVNNNTKTFGNFGTINWLDKPQKISSLNIFNLELFNQRKKIAEKTSDYTALNDDYQFSDAEFFQVASFSNGAKLIDVYVVPNSPAGTGIIRLIQDTTTTYLLKDMSVNLEIDDEFKEYLNDSLVLSDLVIDELNSPSTINLGDKNILYIKESIKGSSRKSDELTNLKKVADSEYGEIYSNTFNVFNNISVDQLAGRVFYLKSRDGNFTAYNYNFDEITDDQKPAIIWNSGSTNNDVFTQNLYAGCGSDKVGSVPVILNDSNLIKDKVEVGKTKNGNSVYQIQNKSNQFLLALYNSYKETRIYDKDTALLSLDEYISQNNHFLWQDPSGDWQIFVNQNYASLAECGKPVIYLYPQQETPVKVQVGAQITKSEPTYPSQGWLVTAKPNGELTYQNQSYPYLFWEGLGNGIYPDYKDQGTLVSQKELTPTLYKQLSQLGLNQKESADFMEFWQPKLPKTPYIRLTWLNTQDMAKLAPLTVNPKPDTSIRIFLEFEGLEKPVTLKPQNLTAPERNGFTLIEWGGLLLKARE